MYQDKMIAVDVSKYQRKISGWELRQAGVDVVIAKADELFVQHAREAASYELVLGTYIWSDPIEASEITFNRAMKILDGWPVAFAAVDLEQWWANWGSWSQAILQKLAWNLVSRAKPEKIQGHALNLGNLLRKEFPTLMYSSYGFCTSYVPGAKTWMCDWEVWAAHYGRQPAKSICCEWSEVFKNWLPSYKVLSPPGTTRLVGHQFTGDRIKVPGMYSDAAGRYRSAADISVFDAAWLNKVLIARAQG